MVKLECTLPDLANICLHKSTTAKFYPFKKSDKDLMEKILEGMLGGHSTVFTRQVAVDETLIQHSTILCKIFVGFDASERYPFSMCQAMPTVLYTKCELDSESGKNKPRQNKTRGFGNMVVPYFQRVRPQSKGESFFTTGTQEKNDAYSVDGYYGDCNTVFEAMACYYRYCPCQKARPSLIAEEIQRGNEKRELDKLRKHYVQSNGYDVIEMYECNCWNMYKTDKIVKQHLRESFPIKLLRREERLLENMKPGNLFGYVQCHNEVPENLRESIANFAPIFKNINNGRVDIGPFMNEIAEKEGPLTRPRRMIISSYFLENGTVFTPLLLLYLNLGHVCRKVYRFVQYTPMKCFNNFVQSALNARRKRDENASSSVVAETMKLLANSSYDFQIMDRRPNTPKRYLSGKKTHGAINKEKFKRLGYINEQLYEVQLVKSEYQHKEPIIVEFYIRNYAKLRMLEL